MSLGHGASACAAIAARPADPGLFLIAPSAAGRVVSVAQAVRVEHEGGAEPFETLAAVELDRHWLRVAALGPLGNRVLFLEWDGNVFHEERDPHLPAQFPSKLVLRDLELALFPAAAVRAALPSRAWSLVDGPRHRELRLDGKPVIAIDYSADDPWKSDVHFRHFTLHYQLEIHPVDSQ